MEMDFEKQRETPQNDENAKRQRKTTLCCLTEDQLNNCSSHKWIAIRFIALFVISLLILCCVYGLKSADSHGHGKSAENYYAVGDPVYARDLWLVVELPSDDQGRRTAEGREAAVHVCSAILAAQKAGWTPLIVGGRSNCCRSSRCRYLHPKDLGRLNYTLSAHYDRQGQIRMALKTAGFLAAIERGARFIFQANPEVYYRAGLTPQQYQHELERQLQKTTVGLSVGSVKSFRPESKDTFDPYSHFGQTFQNAQSDNNINEYKICEVKPPSIEKFLDADGQSLDLSAPAVIIPGGRASAFDTRNTAFGRDIFPALFLLPEHGGLNEKDQYYIRSIFANALLKLSAGSSKFSVAEISTVTANDIIAKSSLTNEFSNFIDNWTCDKVTVLRCMLELAGQLMQNDLIQLSDLTYIEMWVRDLKDIGWPFLPQKDDIAVVQPSQAKDEPCYGEDSLSGVYFHPSVRIKEIEHRARQGKFLDEDDFRNQLQKSASFASRMLQTLCPSIDIKKAVANQNQYDPHDNILLIVTFFKKDYETIPLLEIMYRHHFKNILYCGEPDEVVDKYMEHYNGQSGTYFSFLPVFHMQSAGYECLLGAIEMGYRVEGFLLVNENTLVNSWNFGNDLDLSTVWHGNEHAINVTSANLNELATKKDDIMKSMLGILQAFQFLENVLFAGEEASKTSSNSQVLVPPPLVTNEEHHHNRRRRDTEDSEESEDYSIEEMKMMHDYADEEGDDDEDEHEMSVVDDHGNSNKTNEWHIDIFGELAHNEPEAESVTVEPKNASTTATAKEAKEARELLFHPANFKKDDQSVSFPVDDMKSEHFNDMMFSIQSVYKRIDDKLKLWTEFRHMKMSHSSDHDKMEHMKKELEHLHCKSAANSELCLVISKFFSTLDSNEGDSFQLIYDDLPIYYVPESLKQRAFLFANIFTKYQINDKLAFPLLLRGLEHTENWTKLNRVELKEDIATPDILNPEDLLNAATNDNFETLDELESAHYLYPVDIKKVLTNDDLRTVVCRNF